MRIACMAISLFRDQFTRSYRQGASEDDDLKNRNTYPLRVEHPIKRSAVALALAALALAGLPLAALAEPKLPADPDLIKSDVALLQDEAKATAEFQRRLRAQVASHGGLLVIQDRSGASPGVTVMPATALWGVECSDSGVAVVFGAGSGDTDNGIVLQLTSAAISDDKCTRIAPAIGEAVLALTKGN
jgi:hypothetical protein